MYNTYISSTITFRSKASLYFSLNDYYSVNERYDHNSCSSCTCCSFPCYEVPVNPRFLYGLRQSSLIHCSASRRLILSARDRCCRLPVCDSDRICYGNSYSFKETNSSSSCRKKERGIGRRGRRFGCMVWEEKSEDFDNDVDGNAEAMLSLLTEDIGEKIIEIGRRKNRSGNGVFRVETRRSGVSEGIKEDKKYVGSGSFERDLRGRRESVGIKLREEGNNRWSGRAEGSSKSENRGLRKQGFSSSSYSSGRFQVEKRRGDVCESVKEEKKYVESGSLDRNSRCECGAVKNKSREVGRRWSGENEGSSRGEYRGLRKEGSSCSSYYSAMSTEDTDESNLDVQVKHERFGGESSSNYRNEESSKNEVGRFGGDVKKQFNKYEEDVKRHGEASTQKSIEVGRDETVIGIDECLRNEEEKLIEVEETNRASRSERRFSGRESRDDNSTSSINVVEETRNQRSQKGHQVIQESESRDNNSTSSSNFVEETRNQRSQTGHQVIQQFESRRKTQQQTAISDIQDNDNVRASSSQKQFGEREEKLTAAVNLVLEARERNSRMDRRSIEQNESTRKSQQLNKVSDIHDSDPGRASNTQKLLETRMKNREEDSTSLLSSFQEARVRRTQADQEVVEKTRPRKESQDLTNISVNSARDTEALTSSQKLTETRMRIQEENSASCMDLVLEARKKDNRTGEQLIRQVRSSKESQKPSTPFNFRERSNEGVSSTQSQLNLVQQAREQHMGALKMDERNSQVMVTPPPSQLVARGSTEVVVSRKPSNHYAIQEESFEPSESSTSALYIPPQGEAPASRHELDGETRSNDVYTEHLSQLVNEDALVSVNRLEESSTMFVGEFMEKLKGEVSTSEFLEDRTSSQSHQVKVEDFQSQVHSSMQSSTVPGKRGPSDEMWDVAGPSQEPSKIEAPAEVTPTTENAIVKGTNRSLWRIVSDIVRMRWGTRSETHSSALKSGERSSPNESVGSEAWFSGNEPDDENVKKGRRGTPIRSRSADLPHPRETSAQSQGEAYDVMGSHDNITQTEAYTSSSSNTAEGNSASKGASSASRVETSGWKEDDNRGQGIPSSIIPSDSSLPSLKRRLIRSPPVEGETFESNIEVSRSGSKQMIEQTITETPNKASGTGGKDGELKQRKFERNKQVLKERFEEWEEAYTIESEQRKIDEMFMREALLEAKKAADTWEVPVGAVLVQHGKIIARGCNLVEELRDSTAHAEMICIREASNVLQTWRLAETTLYVTLEPCPMCAGAILQARIDTVVWGAPNKLLGADGSWVRLFPGGGAGGSSSDLTQQAGPIHPFHPKMAIRRGILSTECADVMQQFFQLRRRKKEKKVESSPPPPPSCLPISAHPSKFLTRMHDVFHIMFCL